MLWGGSPLVLQKGASKLEDEKKLSLRKLTIKIMVEKYSMKMFVPEREV